MHISILIENFESTFIVILMNDTIIITFNDTQYILIQLLSFMFYLNPFFWDILYLVDTFVHTYYVKLSV